MKLYKESKIYKGKDGKEKQGINFYVVAVNGVKVYIKPAFSSKDNPRDYYTLCAIAEERLPF